MSEKTKYCIFCFRKNTEVPFSREHIIPKCVGGNLFIDEVCNRCNSSLGRFIDIQILKYPEILDAFEKLQIAHDKSGIFRNYYKVTGKSDNLEVEAIYQDGKYTMLPKEMPDGSIIIPEEKYDHVLEKMVQRDERIKSSKVSKEYLNEEFKKIKAKYRNAKSGELVQGASVGRSLLKRRDKFQIVIEPKGTCEIERLIAKIYYEFMYFVEGRFVFHRALDLQPIFDLIDRGSKSEAYYFSRQQPKFDKPIPAHLIRFIFRDTYQQLYVSFFGILDFTFMTFYHHHNFWDDIEKRYKRKNINGIHFEQSVKTGDKYFCFIDSDDKMILI